ncbi:hypothetical protein [Clostridium sp. HBUAS56017]|uniref:L-type lectin-domain containing protein n=1 Tax=Clostridium sp. HBUAS56017 TaxID=2571128 RepID=UPI00163DDD47|nr:hypothetical protein [Clostridium sp. HBUAS56017]
MIKLVKYILRTSVVTLSLALLINVPKVYTYAAEENQLVNNSEAAKTITATKEKNTNEKNKLFETNYVVNNVATSNVSAVAATEDGKLTEEDKALQRINDGVEDLSDYTLLKIRKVKSDNLNIIKKLIQDEKVKKGSNLTREDISTTVSNGLKNITTVLDKINLGGATVDEYKFLEITVVNDSNLKDINEWLKGQGFTNINTLKDAVNRIVQAIQNINNGIETANDYKTLQINSVEEDYVPLIRKEIASVKVQKAGDLTKSEISDVATKAVNKINAILDFISQGKATVLDYTYIGVVNVNNINLQDVNLWMRGKKWIKLTDEIGMINTIVEPLRKINAGIEAEKDYEILGIDGVNQSNLEAVRAVIAEKKQIKGAELTKLEIADAVDEAVRLIDFFDAINSGTATLDDYNYIGATGVNDSNLQDLNEELKGKDYKTLKKVQDNIDVFNKAIKNINQGIDSIADYGTLKIEGVTENNIEFVRADIKEARDNKKSDLTKAEIKDIVTASLKKFKAIEAINNGAATIEDYTLLGITVVTDVNIKFINDNIKGNNYKTLEEITVKVQKLIKVYDAYLRINLGAGTLDDYELIGAVISRVDLLNYINVELTDKGYFTLVEVQAKIDVVIKVRVAIENINNGTATIDDYATIGAVGVTVDNLVYVNAELKGKNLKTLPEIQVKIDVVVKFTAVIERIDAGTATVDDYTAIGITVVNDINLAYVNGQVVGKGYLTVAEIKVAVETAIKFKGIFEKVNLGIATVEDYQFIGITGVTIQNLAYVNAHVRGKKFVTVDTLQARVDIVVEIYESILKINKIYENINLGQAAVEDYAYIGVVGVTVDNLTYINADLKGKGYVTSTDIQLRVNVLVKVYDAFVRINAGEATLDDYKLIGVVGATAENLAYVNLNVKGNNYFVLADVQAKVDVIVNMYNSFVKVNIGEATLDDYKLIGVVGVTVKNLAYVNLNVKGSSYFVLADVQAKVDVIVKMYNSFVRINAGEGTVDDYNTIGVVGITVDNLAYVNLNVRGNNFFVTADVQAKVDVLVKLFDAYVRIGADTAQVDDYILIGANGVTVDNLPYINADLKGRKYTVLTNVQARIDIVVKLYPSFTRINAGEGTVVDYELMGAIGVTVDNLIYVNADLKGKNYLTATEIKARVEVNINIYNALIRINAGEGTLDDYNVVGAVGVTVDNLIYVNSNIKGLGLGTYDEVKTKVKTIVAQYELDLKVTAILGRINAGEATVDDYAFINIKGVTVDNLIYVNADLKGRGARTHLDIQARVNVIANLYASFVRVNAGEATLADYTVLGITGITVDNLIYVNADLKGKNYVTSAEIQARINVSNKAYVALGRIDAGEGTIDDYTLLGIVEVTVDNLGYVNGELKGGKLLTVEEAKVKAINVVNVYNALIKINIGEATIDDYVLIGAVGVTVDNLIYVNIDLKDKNYMNLKDIQVRINMVINIRNALGKINAGEGTVDDYVFIGTSGVTVDNLIYVNAELQGKVCNYPSEVQTVINKVLSSVDILIRINYGKATIDDYVKLGISGVTENNIDFINEQVKGKKYLTVSEVKVAVDNEVAIYISLGKMNDGKATVEDYQLLGLVEVNIDNIFYVNEALKGKHFMSVGEVTAQVNNVVKYHQAFDRIVSGHGALEDYTLVNITGVTGENLIFINDGVARKGCKTVEEIQGYITDSALLIQTLIRVNNGEATLDDYYYLGIKDVTVDNLIYVNADIKGKKYTDPAKLLIDIQVIINVNNSYIKVKNGKGTLEDFVTIGIKGVTEANLVKVNDAILKGDIIKFKDDNLSNKIKVLQASIDIVTAEEPAYSGFGTTKKVADYIQLTPLATWQSGGIWCDNSIDTTNGFILNFEYCIGGGRGDSHGGADGLVVNLAPKKGNFGGQGGDLNFNGPGTYGVEFDSYVNEFDPGCKHVAIIKDSVANHLAYKADMRVDDNVWHSVRIEYVSDNIQIYIDNQLELEYKGIKLDKQIFIGISASTGAGYNQHLIRNITSKVKTI